MSLTLVGSLLLFLAQDPPAATPQRLRIGGNVQASKLVKKVTPVYPPLAKQARIQGTVRFNVIIDREGAIQNLQLVAGHPMLVTAAQEAVRQWMYQPTLLNGNPVEVVTVIDVNFTLSDPPAWAVNWSFLSQFRISGNEPLSSEDSRMPAKLLAAGTLSGELSEAAKAIRFQPLTLDQQPFEPVLVSAPQAEGIPDITAAWPQMAQRILARRDGVKPREELTGRVGLMVVVNAEGNVEKVLEAYGSNEELKAEAKRVIVDWRFRPVVINGRAYAVRTTVPFEFQ